MLQADDCKYCAQEGDRVPSVSNEEGHALGGHCAGGRDEVAFILAAFVIEDHHKLASPDGLNRLRDAVELERPARAWGIVRHDHGLRTSPPTNQPL